MGMCEQYRRWCTVRSEGVPKNVQPPFWQDAARLNAGQWLMVRQVCKPVGTPFLSYLVAEERPLTEDHVVVRFGRGDVDVCGPATKAE